MTDSKDLGEAFLGAGSRVTAAYEAEDLEALMQATMDCMDIFTQVAEGAAKSIEVAVAQRDALQAEVDRLRSSTLTWRHRTDGKHIRVWSLCLGTVTQYVHQPIPTEEMLQVEAYFGLPECEVVE